jgi:hypothetical protein
MRERRAAMTITTTGTMSTTGTKRAIYTRMGTVAVGPGKEDVAGAMRKYCEDDVDVVEEEEDANEEAEEEAGKEDNRESGDDADGFEALFKSLSSSPAPPGRAAAPRLAVLPIALSALAQVVIVDTGIFDARAIGARVLVRPPEHDHVLHFVISIARHQRASHANNTDDDDDAAHAPIPTPTPPAFARISAPSPPPSPCARRSRSPSPCLFRSRSPRAAHRAQVAHRCTNT